MTDADDTRQPSRSPELVGGQSVTLRHKARFLGGFAVGTVVRVVERLVPARVERAVKHLLP